jgi:hypothetical protein
MIRHILRYSILAFSYAFYPFQMLFLLNSVAGRRMGRCILFGPISQRKLTPTPPHTALILQLIIKYYEGEQ